MRYVFPAVLYKDAEDKGYTIVLHDLDICTEGSTVEDAFLRAKEFLTTYCKCALAYNGTIEDATKFVDVETSKQNIVLLVDADVGSVDIKAQDFSLDL